MCTWAMRPLLVQTTDGRNIVIDTGAGNKQDEKFRSYFRHMVNKAFLGRLRKQVWVEKTLRMFF